MLKKTNEHAVIVWYDEDEKHDSVLLEIKDKNEMSKFYKRKDFEILKK